MIPLKLRCESIYTFKSIQPCIVRSTAQNNRGVSDPKMFDKKKCRNLSHVIRHKLSASAVLHSNSNGEILKQLHEYDKNYVKKTECNYPNSILNNRRCSYSSGIRHNLRINKNSEIKIRPIPSSSSTSHRRTKTRTSLFLTKMSKDDKENFPLTSTNKESRIISNIKCIIGQYKKRIFNDNPIKNYSANRTKRLISKNLMIVRYDI